MRVADYIVDFLIEKGITDVFGFPGGMVTYLIEALDKRRNEVHSHVTYNEQGAAFAACGYAQLSLKPGVAYATSGPGATNLLTGLCNAYFDSIPAIFITGQVNTYESKGDLKVRQKGFQETDIVSMVKSVTKYSELVTDVQNIRYCLEKAYYTCMEGRPGPVLLDIPMNVQRSEIDPQ
jgi:acetolactate synthase-1/2/3 large subunit